MGGAAFKTGVAITPHDSTDITGGVVQGLYIGGAGNVTVVWADGTTSLLTAVIVGQVYPVVIQRVNATGTTATALVGLRN